MTVVASLYTRKRSGEHSDAVDNPVEGGAGPTISRSARVGEKHSKRISHPVGSKGAPGSTCFAQGHLQLARGGVLAAVTDSRHSADVKTA